MSLFQKAFSFTNLRFNVFIDFCDEFFVDTAKYQCAMFIVDLSCLISASFAPVSGIDLHILDGDIELNFRAWSLAPFILLLSV